jgi:hypothetical protein
MRILRRPNGRRLPSLAPNSDSNDYVDQRYSSEIPCSEVEMRKTLLALSLLALTVTYLPAQEPSRVLNGFEFIPSRIVADPFAISYFATSTGAGQAFDLKTPFIDVDGDTLGTLTGDVAFLSLGFEYQQRFGQWLALRVGFSGGGRIGTDEQSMLAQGVTGTFAVNLGGTARIYQSEKVIISGGLDFSRSDIVGVDPFGFAQRIIDSGGLEEDNSLSTSGKATSGVLSARLGWAPASWIGITAVLDGGRADLTDSDSETRIGGGGTMGVDLKNLNVIPIGLLLSAESDAFSQNGADLTNRSTGFGLGVFWTGWEKFIIGIETTMRVLDRRDADDDFEAFVVTFNLRYWP